MSDLDATIAICTYNRADTLPHALAASTGQTLSPARYEVLVVDNNCTDATADIARATAEKHANVRVVREKQQGLSHARNRALIEAHGDVVVFVDDDALLTPAYLTRLAQVLVDEDNVGLIGGPVEPVWLGEPPAEFDKRLLAFMNTFDRGNERCELPRRDSLIGTNLAVPLSVAQQLGGFLPELGRSGGGLHGGEDTEYCQRVQEAGLRVIYDPGCRCQHINLPERGTWAGARQRAWQHGRANAAILRRSRHVKPLRHALVWLARYVYHHGGELLTKPQARVALRSGLGSLYGVLLDRGGTLEPPPGIRNVHR